MSVTDGEKARGWWKVRSVEAPLRLEFDDGFADDSGNPNPDMPVMVMRVDLTENTGGGTRMTVQTTFPSAEDMDKILSMGMEEGLTSAMGQIDGVIAAT